MRRRYSRKQRLTTTPSSSAQALPFVGPAGCTTTTGFPVAANTPVLIPTTTGAETLKLYGVATSGTATISYLSIA